MRNRDICIIKEDCPKLAELVSTIEKLQLSIDAQLVRQKRHALYKVGL